MQPRRRPPTTPGEMLREELLLPRGITQAPLAAKMGASAQTVSAIVRGRRRVTSAVAVKLSRALGTTWQFWSNLQESCDRWWAEHEPRRS